MENEVVIEEEIYEYFRKEAMKALGPTPEGLINDVLRDYIYKKEQEDMMFWLGIPVGFIIAFVALGIYYFVDTFIQRNK